MNPVFDPNAPHGIFNRMSPKIGPSGKGLQETFIGQKGALFEHGSKAFAGWAPGFGPTDNAQEPEVQTPEQEEPEAKPQPTTQEPNALRCKVDGCGQTYKFKGEKSKRLAMGRMKKHLKDNHGIEVNK